MPQTISGEGYREFSEPRFFECAVLADVAKIRNPVDKAHALLGTSNGLEAWKFDSSSDSASDSWDVISSSNTGVAGRWKRIGNIVPVTLFGAIGNDSTDNSSVLATAISTVPAGSTLFFPRGTYRITDAITVNKSLKFAGELGATIKQVTANKGAFIVTASSVEFNGLFITGPQFAASRANEHGIYFQGPSAASAISRFRVENCVISNWGQNGIYAEWANDLFLSSNRIFDIWYAGIQVLSGLRGEISSNNIRNIVGTPNAYGISLTRSNSDSLVTHPRTADFAVVGNVIEDVEIWEGIDTHGGERIVIAANKISNVLTGINVTRANNLAGAETFPALNISVVGNVLESGVTDGTRGSGINFVGVSGGASSTGCISGNSIKNFGQDAEGFGGIFMRDTQGLSVTGNTILEPARYGININENNKNLLVSGNTVIDPWSATASTGVAFRVRAENNVGFISNNRAGKDSKVATSVLTYGIRIAANNTIEVGVNSIVGAATNAVFRDGIGGFDGTLQADGYIEGVEIADPDAPPSNRGRLYFKDNGSGKTQLVARFPTGAVQVIATEP